jgi:phenylalanine-4-hydroxylase
MAFRVGGVYGLQKAIESKNTCTAVYSSGLQVSGTFTDYILNDNKEPVFIRTTGPTALAVDNRQIKGHGKIYHSHGFSSPVGKLKGHAMPLENLSITDLNYFGIEEGKETTLNFESGITVNGTIKNIMASDKKIQLITFEDCTIKDKDGKLLFDQTWGVYDMAVGEKIVSVFCGAADKTAFAEALYKSKAETHHPEYDYNTRELHQLYQQVRNRRQNGGDFGFLGNVWLRLQKNHHDDWLCALEILEILEHEEVEPLLAQEIRTFLEQKAINEPQYKKLISDGFYLIKHPVEQKLVV